MIATEPQPLTSSEVEDIARRLQERDVQLDIHAAIHRMIATLHDRDAEIAAQVRVARSATLDVVEVNTRLDALNVEITRRDAVIAMARRHVRTGQAADLAMLAMLARFDDGELVLEG